MKISPQAIIDPSAELAADVEVGPFCMIGPKVRIDSGTRLLGSVTIFGPTTIGRDNVIHPGVILGGDPQDRRYRGSPTRLEIGNGNVIRECATIHRGTDKGGGISRVGDGNYIMCYCHVGHDVHLGNNCTIANNAMIAGHVIILDNVVMGGGVGIHQFVTVGEYCFLGGASKIHHDAPPFMRIDGSDQVRGVNIRALNKLAGFTEDDVESLENACRKLFYKKQTFAAALAEFDTLNGLNSHVKRLVEFLRLRDQGKHGRYLEATRN